MAFAPRTWAAEQAGWRAEIWEPLPFRPSYALSAPEDDFREWQETLRSRATTLQQRASQLESVQESVMASGREAADWLSSIEGRERDLACRQEEFYQVWNVQETALLHLVVFRLVRIQALAMSPPAIERKAEITDTDEDNRPPHPNWGGVTLLVCMPGSLRDVSGDFPIRNVLRFSSSPDLHDLCGENVEGGPGALLELLLTSLLKATRSSSASGQPSLYYVLPGHNVFFNEPPGTPQSFRRGSHVASEGRAHSAEILLRYEEIMGSSPVPKVVVATRWHCKDADGEEATACLRGGAGFAGPSGALEEVVDGLLQLLSQDKSASLDELFKRFSVVRPGLLVPDSGQLLFGSMEVAVPGSCSGPRAGDETCGFMKPCCVISDDFDQLHHAFHSNFEADNCSLLRHGLGRAPISWHGDDAKWMFILVLDALTSSCPYIAGLVLGNHPSGLLDSLFRRFEAAQAPGAVQGQSER